MAFDQITSSLPHVESGKLRALAVTSLKRFPSVPNLPSMSEAGITGYDAEYTTPFGYNALNVALGRGRHDIADVLTRAGARR